jgi:fumarate hydratase class II
MYTTGDYVEPAQSFNSDFWSPCTKIFMEYITKDLEDRQWDGIFRGLAAILVKVSMDVAVMNRVPQAPKLARVPLPTSDPPSSPARVNQCD